MAIDSPHTANPKAAVPNMMVPGVKFDPPGSFVSPVCASAGALNVSRAVHTAAIFHIVSPSIGTAMHKLPEPAVRVNLSRGYLETEMPCPDR
jgi:hypothetical protein